MSTNQKVGATENANTTASGSPVVDAANGPRLEEVEKEVKKLKADIEGFIGLKNTVDDLKNTIVDIRALISEAQSPFNLLQFITNEEDLNKVIQAKPIIEKKLLADKVAEKSTEIKGSVQAEIPSIAVTEAAKTNSLTGFAVESTMESKGTAQIEAPYTTGIEKAENKVKICPDSSLEEQDAEKSKAYSSLEKVDLGVMNKDTSIIHWVYMMLDLGFDEKSIRKICDYCEFSGFMPNGYGTQVSNLVGAIAKARSQNLSAEEVILSIYGAANAVGVKTNPDDLKRLIVSVLRKSKTGET